MSVIEKIKMLDHEAAEKIAYETVGKLEGDVTILTKEELLALRGYILEMEEAVFNGAFAPVKPNVVNKLLG